MSNIYGEVVPQKHNLKDKNETKEYPKELIMTFDTLIKPNLGDVITSIRNYSIQCAESGINPEINLSFCFDYDSGDSFLFKQKFISIAEYILQIKKQMPGIKFTAIFRGYLFPSLYPIMLVCDTVIISKLTLVKEPINEPEINDWNSLFKKFEMEYIDFNDFFKQVIRI